MDELEKMMRDSESRMIAYFESAIMPKFDLLADGQKNILEIMTPKTDLEKLREEVEFLRNVVKFHAKEINELKKAQ